MFSCIFFCFCISFCYTILLLSLFLLFFFLFYCLITLIAFAFSFSFAFIPQGQECIATAGEVSLAETASMPQQMSYENDDGYLQISLLTLHSLSIPTRHFFPLLYFLYCIFIPILTLCFFLWNIYFSQRS